VTNKAKNGGKLEALDAAVRRAYRRLNDALFRGRAGAEIERLRQGVIEAHLRWREAATE
jgi:hypothetical protein